MNTIYRLVWNSARHCFVVSSELSRRRGKPGRTVGAISLLLVVGGLCTAASATEIVATTACTDTDASMLMLEPESAECRRLREAQRGVLVPAAANAMHIAMNTSGVEASATGDNAMAFGPGAVAEGMSSIAFGVKHGGGGVTSALAAYAIAVGTGANVTASNGIALGSNASATAVGGIAIGNMAQVAREEGQVAGTGGQHGIAIGNYARVEMYEGDIYSGQGGVALGYAAHSAGKNAIALGAESIADEDETLSIGGLTIKRRIVGMQDGTGEDNAVTIRQLGSVASALGGGASLVDGAFVAPTYHVRGTDHATVGGALEALDSAIDDIDPGAGGGGGDNGLIEKNGSTIAIGKSLTGLNVSLADAGGNARVLTGVADGVAAEDVVNVRQLDARATEIGASVTALDTAMQTSVGELETKIASVSDGLVETNDAVGTLSTDIGALEVAVGQQATAITDLGTSVNGRIDEHGIRLDDVEQRVDALESMGPAPGNDLIAFENGTITLGAEVAATTVSLAASDGTARLLTGLKDGVGDTDAVTMSQLNATNAVVAGFDGKIATVEAGLTSLTDHVDTSVGALRSETESGFTRTDTEMGALNAGLVTVNSTIGGMQTAISGMQTTIGEVSTDLADLTDRVDHLVPGGPGQGDNGLVQQDAEGTISIGAGKAGNVVSVAGVGDRTVRGVAAGTEDNDAVNVGQLKAAGLVDDDGNARAAVVYDIVDGTRDGESRITLAGVNGTVIANVGDGRIEAGSRDAVNGGQVAQIRDELKQDIAVLDDRLDAVEAGTPVSPVPEPEPGPGPGPQPGDGDYVTGQDLQDQIDRAKSYTDGRFVELNDTIDTLRKDVDERFKVQDRRISRIGAMGAAMAQMTSNMSGVRGENRVGAGIGTQGGERALSLGYQRYVEKTNTSVGIGGAFSGGEAQMGVGVGFGW